MLLIRTFYWRVFLTVLFAVPSSSAKQSARSRRNEGVRENCRSCSARHSSGPPYSQSTSRPSSSTASACGYKRKAVPNQSTRRRTVPHLVPSHLADLLQCHWGRTQQGSIRHWLSEARSDSLPSQQTRLEPDFAKPINGGQRFRQPATGFI